MSTESLETSVTPSISQRVSDLFYPYHSSIKRAIVWISIFQILSLGEPYIFATIIDDLIKGRPKNIIVYKLIFAFVVLLVLLVMKRIKDVSIRLVGSAIGEELNPTLLKKMLALPLSFHERESSGRLIAKVTLGIQKLVDASYMIFHDFVPIVVQSMVCLIVLLCVDWRPALLVAAMVSVLIVIRIRVNARVRHNRAARNELRSDIASHASQCLHNVLTTQAFAQESREYVENKTLNSVYRDKFEWEHLAYERADVSSGFMVNLGRIGVIALSAYAASHGKYGVGTLTFIVFLAERLFASCYRIGGIYLLAVECIEPIMTLTNILNESETIQSPTLPLLPVTTAGKRQPLRGSIDIRNLFFRYTSTSRSVKQNPDLRIHSLHIDADKTIGIVGYTGSGKSTFVNLLLRFYDPQHGQIFIDTVDIRQIDLTFLRQSIGYVPQEVELYDVSIGENIAYGQPGSSAKDIIAAARAADVHEFIMTLEQGYDTLVGNKGMKLSGGQKQKIGIARALLLSPSILIFDEATSSVDSFSEREIQQTIDRVCKNRTAIIIAHRLSTVRRCHAILVMRKGEIVEYGNHEELMRRKGLYFEMIRIQEQQDLFSPNTNPKLLN